MQTDLRNFLTSNYRSAYANECRHRRAAVEDSQPDIMRMLAARASTRCSPGSESVANEAMRAGDVRRQRQAMAASEDQAQQPSDEQRHHYAEPAGPQALCAASVSASTSPRPRPGQWQTQADAWNQQEAMANWQRQNQVTDTNTQNTAAYRTGAAGVLGLANSNVGNNGITLPDMGALGLG